MGGGPSDRHSDYVQGSRRRRKQADIPAERRVCSPTWCLVLRPLWRRSDFGSIVSFFPIGPHDVVFFHYYSVTQPSVVNAHIWHKCYFHCAGFVLSSSAKMRNGGGWHVLFSVDSCLPLNRLTRSLL